MRFLMWIFCADFDANLVKASPLGLDAEFGVDPHPIRFQCGFGVDF